MTKKKKLTILYEDKNLLIVDKPAKLLTIATSKEKEHTLYHEVSDYVKKQYPKNKVFIVNRLDKDTSGIVVFAKNEETKKEYQNNWQDYALNREYLAIVEGRVSKEKDTLKYHLKEDHNFKVHVCDEGELAITEYQVLEKNKSYSLLKIKILTGKKNQIRVSLSNINHPIVGDKKYGSLKNPINRLGLHANVLELKINGKPVIIKTKIPKEFKLMFKSLD